MHRIIPRRNDTNPELTSRLIALFDAKRHYHRGSSGLKTVPMRILERVTERGEIQTLDLAKAADLAPATLIGILDDLEARGHLMRTRSREDKRVVLVSLTPGGAGLVALRAAEERSFRSKLDAGLEEAERRELERLLEKMLDGIVDETALFKE